MAIEPPQLEKLLVDLPLGTPLPVGASERVVLLISKDHADRLHFTLPMVAAECDRLYVLDSSRTRETRDLCRALSDPVDYHGPDEQRREISRQPTLQRALAAGFLTDQALDCWDIWSKRNYALLYALLHGIRHILLMDDDVIPSPGLIREVLALSAKHCAVGAAIKGMPDTSIVGHIGDLHGVRAQSFVSGHFLALDVAWAARHHFPPVYNEDWMFVVLNGVTRPVARYGTVFHQYWNPFDDTERRAAFEEPGEILVEGLVSALMSNGGLALLDCADHWTATLSRRRLELDWLASSNLSRHSSHLSRLLQASRTSAAAVTPEQCVTFWGEYKNSLTAWCALVDGAIAASEDAQHGSDCTRAETEQTEHH